MWRFIRQAICSSLVEARLLHDSDELLLVDLAVVIQVGFVDHFLQLLVGQILAELFGHTLEVLETDLAVLVVVEQSMYVVGFVG